MDHRLKFLRDDAVFRINAKSRSGKIEQSWKLDFFRAWNDGIAEADVELKGNPCASQLRQKAQPNAMVDHSLTNFFASDGIRFKTNTVVRRDIAYLTEERFHLPEI